MQDINTPDLLTLEEVADRLHLSHWGLRRRMQKRGTHGARKIGRRWWFDPSVLTSDLARPG